jgi:hypothetical protein
LNEWAGRNMSQYIKKTNRSSMDNNRKNARHRHVPDASAGQNPLNWLKQKTDELNIKKTDELNIEGRA